MQSIGICLKKFYQLKKLKITKKARKYKGLGYNKQKNIKMEKGW